MKGIFCSIILSLVILTSGLGAENPALQENQKVTLEDYLGTPTTAREWAKAAKAAKRADMGSLMLQKQEIVKGSSRSEREMLVAVQLGHFPRFLARVGPTDSFTKYKTFGNPGHPFIFTGIPSDLRGINGAEAMSKVGWLKDDIQGLINQEISVCIFDTSVPIGDNPPATVIVGELGWNELQQQALEDATFLDAASAKGISKDMLPNLFYIWSITPVGQPPKTDQPEDKKNALIVRGLINQYFSANPLYTGIGATMQSNGKLGARELMVLANGTNFSLTENNHVLVSLGVLTQDDFDKVFPEGK